MLYQIMINRVTDTGVNSNPGCVMWYKIIITMLDIVVETV